MRPLTRLVAKHAPLALLAAAVLCVVACHHDEPWGNRPGQANGSETPADTVHQPSDTTNQPADTTNHPTDTTGNDTTSTDTTASVFTLTLSAPRDYGYMGQTLQLNASTSKPATVKWSSSNPLAATVDAQGLVTIANCVADASTTVTATAGGTSDSLTIHCLYWAVAALTHNTWSTEAYPQIHRGDTLALTIVNSSLAVIDDASFNAAACQWTVSSQTPNAASMLTVLETPTANNGWQMRFVVLPDMPTGITFTVIAQVGKAASFITCAVVP